jgi:hypothetical protein
MWGACLTISCSSYNDPDLDTLDLFTVYLMNLSVAYINYIAPNGKLTNITLEKDMADIGHGLVSSFILTYA